MGSTISTWSEIRKRVGSTGILPHPVLPTIMCDLELVKAEERRFVTAEDGVGPVIRRQTRTIYLQGRPFDRHHHHH